MPSHSSHLLQPLDVGCFSVLKQSYSQEIEKLMRNHIHHITKPDFFLAFHAEFWAAFYPENVQGGFRGARLVPFDPERVISRLDIKLQAANEALSKRRRAKKRHIRAEGPLSMHEATEILTDKDV